MDMLLCDEDWLSCSTDQTREENHRAVKHGGFGGRVTSSICLTIMMKEVDEQAVSIGMEKEMSYMPEPYYKEFLESRDLVFVRLRCIQWIIKVKLLFFLLLFIDFHLFVLISSH